MPTPDDLSVLYHELHDWLEWLAKSNRLGVSEAQWLADKLAECSAVRKQLEQSDG